MRRRSRPSNARRSGPLSVSNTPLLGQAMRSKTTAQPTMRRGFCPAATPTSYAASPAAPSTPPQWPPSASGWLAGLALRPKACHPSLRGPRLPSPHRVLTPTPHPSLPHEEAKERPLSEVETRSSVPFCDFSTPQPTLPPARSFATTITNLTSGTAITTSTLWRCTAKRSSSDTRKQTSEQRRKPAHWRPPRPAGSGRRRVVVLPLLKAESCSLPANNRTGTTMRLLPNQTTTRTPFGPAA